MYANNVPEWVLLEYGCGLAGMTLVTVNPAYQPRELHMCSSSRERRRLQRRRVPRQPDGRDRRRPCAPSSPRPARDLLDGRRRAVRRRARRPAAATPAPRDPAQIQYTSGTTGFPKGAVLHHRGITNNARLYAMRLGGADAGRRARTSCRCSTPPAAASPRWARRSRGAAMLLAPVFDPACIARADRDASGANVRARRADHARRALDAARRRGRATSRRVRIVLGRRRWCRRTWSAASQDAARRAFQIVYGQTEMSPAAHP